MRGERLAAVYVRAALGSAFLSAVATRFGLWRDRGPHPFAKFISYTGEVNAFLPPVTYPLLAVAATAAETILGIALLTVPRRWPALGSGILLALFGVAMTISGGVKSSLDASVFTASAAAFLLSARGARHAGIEERRDQTCASEEAGDRVESPASPTPASTRRL